MLVMEVRVNGKLLAVAGREDMSVLSATLTAVGVLGMASRGTRGIEKGYSVDLHVGGLAKGKEGRADEYPRWIPRRALVAGDTVTFLCRESDSADVPIVASECPESHPHSATLTKDAILAFQVEVNGKRWARAGRDDLCVLTVGLSAPGLSHTKTSPHGSRTEVYFHVGGLALGDEDKDNRHLQWPGCGFLSPWDAKVTVRVLTTDGFDPPLDPSINPVLTKRMLDDYERLERYEANDKGRKLRRATQRRICNRMRLTRIKMRVR